jgi:polyhydroxybutyrate depolymerase
MSIQRISKGSRDIGYAMIVGYLLIAQACGTDKKENTAGNSATSIADAAISASSDAGVLDSRVVDSRVADATAVDSRVVDSHVADAKVVDARVADSSVADSGAPDAMSAVDTGTKATDSAVDAFADSAGDAVADAGTPSSCLKQSLGAGEHTFTIKSANGLTYKYYLLVPQSYKPTTPTPLVVVWHALSSNAAEARSLTNYDGAAEKTGAITVFPESPDKSWDVGSCCREMAGMFEGANPTRDELVFAKELVAEVESKVCVDSKRVYTHGFSNGGMISQMLACRGADIFAAAAPSASTLTLPREQCTPSRPISVFMINGTADSLVGYNETAFARGITVPETFKMWGTLNKCTGSPVETLKKGAVTCQSYDKCAGDVVVTMCTVEGMGHCMPGMKTESSTNCLTKTGSLLGALPIDIALGTPNNDIDGVQMSFDFLLKYTLP